MKYEKRELSRFDIFINAFSLLLGDFFLFNSYEYLTFALVSNCEQ